MKSVKKELLDFLYDSTKIAIASYLVFATVCLILFYKGNSLLLSIWFISLMFVLFFRFYFYKLYKSNQLPYDKGYAYFFGLVVLSALFWAIFPWFFLDDYGFEYKIFYAFIIGGITSGAVTTLSANLSLIWSYIFIMVFPLVFYLFFGETFFEKFMGMFIFIYALFLSYVSKRINRLYISSVKEKHEKEDLLKALKKREKELRLIFDNVPDGIFFYNKDLKIVDVNDTLVNILNVEKEKLMQLDLNSLVNVEFKKALLKPINSGEIGTYRGEYRTILSNKDIVVDLKALPIKSDEGIIGAIGIMKDLTREKSIQDEIDYLAYHDELTGLYKRDMLFEYIKNSMYRSKRSKMFNSLLFIDLDNFKQINDSLGHDVGDKLLIEISKRLKNAIRRKDIVSRLGGDEFAILLADLDKDRDRALMKSKKIASKIKELISKSVSIGKNTLYIHASIGMTFFNDESKNPFELLKEADSAMYKAKHKGKNSISVFDKNLEKQMKHQIEIMQDLHKAIEKNEFILYYQPQIDIKTNRIIGLEALIRWNHPKKGIILPNDFIPVAEESGLIHKIGKCVLKRASEDIKEIKSVDFIAVNISIKDLMRHDFIESIKEMVEKGDINPQTIELELTESIFIEDFKLAKERVDFLKKIGFKLAIDDFGTGYSSLSYLKHLPIDTLKIDMSFVKGIEKDRDNEVITKTIISIASHFGMKTIAEGVETEYEVEFLKKNGCDIVQGYYFAKPMDKERLKEWLREYSKNKSYNKRKKDEHGAIT